MLHRCNSVLPSIEIPSCISGLHVDFSWYEASTALNGLLTNTELQVMLEKKDYRSVDMVFQFFAGCIDRLTSHDRVSLLTEKNATYSNFVNELKVDPHDTGRKI